MKYDLPNSKPITPCSNPLTIVIPTLGRERIQKTIYNIPKVIRRCAYLVTKASRAPLLRRCNPDVNIIEIPNDVSGIAQTRQLAIEAVPSNKVFMMDDLMDFFVRDDNMKLKKCNGTRHVVDMINDVSKALDMYAHVGISARGGNNRVATYKHDVTRSFSCYGLRKDVLRQLGIRFDDMYNDNNDIKLYEDFYVILAMLSAKYPNTCIYDFAFSHPHNHKGGNSLYRTVQLQKNCAQYLAKRFPNVVKLKLVKGSWGGDMKERYDVTIAWKKAFNG